LHSRSSEHRSYRDPVDRLVRYKINLFQVSPLSIDDQIWNTYSFSSTMLQDVTLNINKKRKH